MNPPKLLPFMSVCINCIASSKDRICKTIASDVFFDTKIQSDLRLQTKEILSTSDSKQKKLQYFSETQVASALVVPSRNGF